ncbi:hypothetical protein OKA05_09165 [Luteolibacter arcticus]|uniref:SMP-30/Gluconolactonase/LRE-like region domain-containing protein n=1 Tax=Luteolibacter arcticus TaxID=1581411 RepID=A0ABT3GGI6_9BACT|nr:hypothetical protein [Luteolibacter arcticus]MCW1922721.1 hypothetical protein [Luteolibacter arcticus]
MKKALLSLLAGLLPWTASASIGELPILHVETYTSPSAKWRLEVDPTNREGSGPGHYRMTHEGKVAWETELPVTLHHATVTDTGITAGFGYSHGTLGFVNGNGPGTLNTLLIDPRGSVLLDDAIPRDAPRPPDTAPIPNASDIIFIPEADRFVLRFWHAFLKESWRTYELSTGKKLDTFDLHATTQAPEAARFIIDARPLHGLPLILVQWWYSDEDSGTLFSLVDLQGKPVWSLPLPRDYTIPGDEKAEDRLHDEIQSDSAILSIGEAGTFTLRLVAEAVQADYHVTRDGNTDPGWKVSRVSNKPYTPPKKEDDEEKPAPAPEAAIAVPQLTPLGAFELQDRPTSGAIRGIDEFAFDPEGRIGFLRREPDNAITFVLVDTKATVLAEIPLPKQKADSTAEYHIAPLSTTRWILTDSTSDPGAKARAWWLDVGKRSLDEIAGFDAPAINAVRATPDGGFVALATRHQEFSSTDYIIRFDATGKQAWTHEASSDKKPATLLSPEDLTVTTRGEIAVLDNIRNQIKWFALDGNHLRTTELEQAWKRKPDYVTNITPDTAGGVIVQDFESTPPFVRMRPDGTVVNELTPKRPDGRVIDAYVGLRAAPDGTLWACDGDAFIQLSDQGAALRDIGSTADDDTLGDIAAVTADAAGSLYAIDRRTAAVHVFSPDGAKLRVCKPAKDDFSTNTWLTHLTVTNDGGVLVQMDSNDEGERYLAFGPDGSRKGIKRLGLDDIKEEWYCQPATGNTLVLGYDAAHLVDPAGKQLEKIERQADRRWFEYLSGAAFAGDGSFVINSSSQRLRENHLTFFDPTGKPLTTVRAQTDGHARLGGYTGRHITLAAERVVRIHDRNGKVIATTPKTDENIMHILARGGKELWVIGLVSHAVTRYEMPE